MKLVLISLCGVVIALVAAGLLLSGHEVSGKFAADNPPATAPSTQPALGVEDLMKHLEQHAGPVVVEGVVSAASSKDQLLSLVDRHEFEECGLAGCAAYTLPVRWAGATPAVKDIVRIKGEVKKDDGGKLAFVASAVDDIGPAVEGKEEGKEK